MINIDHHSSITIHEQIVDKLSHLILSGALKENEKLPSVRQLARDLVVNPHTINKAYATLEEKNLVTCQKNKGYFINPLRKNTKDDEIFKVYEDIKKDIELLLKLGLSKEDILGKLQTTIREMGV